MPRKKELQPPHLWDGDPPIQACAEARLREPQTRPRAQGQRHPLRGRQPEGLGAATTPRQPPCQQPSHGGLPRSIPTAPRLAVGGPGPPESCRAEPRPWGPPAPRRHSGGLQWRQAGAAATWEGAVFLRPPSKPGRAPVGQLARQGQEAAAAPQGGPHHGPATGLQQRHAGVRRARGPAPGRRSPLRPHAHWVSSRSSGLGVPSCNVGAHVLAAPQAARQTR